jgi:hypothetical protein
MYKITNIGDKTKVKNVEKCFKIPEEIIIHTFKENNVSPKL